MVERLTPSEMAERCGMKRREVIQQCIERKIPISNGRIVVADFDSMLSRDTPKGEMSRTHTRTQED